MELDGAVTVTKTVSVTLMVVMAARHDVLASAIKIRTVLIG